MGIGSYMFTKRSRGYAVSSVIREFGFLLATKLVQDIPVSLVSESGAPVLGMQIMSPGYDASKIPVSEVALQVAEVLWVLELLGLVHGDVKPENIVFEYSCSLPGKRRVFLVDYDIGQVIQPVSEIETNEVSVPDTAFGYTESFRMGDPDRIEAGVLNTVNDLFAYEITVSKFIKMARKQNVQVRDSITDLRLARRGDFGPINKSFGDIVSALSSESRRDRIREAVFANAIVRESHALADCVIHPVPWDMPLVSIVSDLIIEEDSEISDDLCRGFPRSEIAAIATAICGTALYAYTDRTIVGIAGVSSTGDLVPAAKETAFRLLLFAASLSQRIRAYRG